MLVHRSKQLSESSQILAPKPSQGTAMSQEVKSQSPKSRTAKSQSTKDQSTKGRTSKPQSIKGQSVKPQVAKNQPKTQVKKRYRDPSRRERIKRAAYKRHLRYVRYQFIRYLDSLSALDATSRAEELCRNAEFFDLSIADRPALVTAIHNLHLKLGQARPLGRLLDIFTNPIYDIDFTELPSLLQERWIDLHGGVDTDLPDSHQDNRFGIYGERIEDYFLDKEYLERLGIL